NASWSSRKTTPFRTTYPCEGVRVPASTWRRVVFPMPFRPVSPVRSGPKEQSRLEKRGVPSGSATLRPCPVSMKDIKGELCQRCGHTYPAPEPGGGQWGRSGVLSLSWAPGRYVLLEEHHAQATYLSLSGVEALIREM